MGLQIIPNLRNWEEVLFLTDVPGWSPHAAYQATRLFVSNMNARLVRKPREEKECRKREEPGERHRPFLSALSGFTEAVTPMPASPWLHASMRGRHTSLRDGAAVTEPC